MIRRRWKFVALACIGVLIAGHLTISWVIEQMFVAGSVIHFADKSVSDFSRNESLQSGLSRPPPASHFEGLKPMAEIEPFGDEAKTWNTFFGFQPGGGVCVFDANGDGRLDVYFCQDGQNWTRPTDESGVLLEKPRAQHNGLYLNQGDDASTGYPRFLPLKELVRVNETYVEEELLVENYLYPRKYPDDSQEKGGRQSVTAAAVDFNNDGLVDLLVGNVLPGIQWSHPKTQRVLAPFVSPIGRETRHSKHPLASLAIHLIDYEARDNLNDLRASSRGMEPLGANTLFLNLGDRDNDGLPEWRDISRESNIEGKRFTVSFAIADFDLDGDLDVFEGNMMDWDYWPAGAQGWAGGANQLYVNQLAETGELTFVESASLMNVDGVFDEDNPMIPHYKLRRFSFLPDQYSLLMPKLNEYVPELLSINGQPAEAGQISLASVFQDVNHDGYPDLWVADDMGVLKLYINESGKSFKRREHARSKTVGSWMSFGTGDYNGDGHEDIFAGNVGGGYYANSFVMPDIYSMFDPVISDGLHLARYAFGYYDTRHVFLDGVDFNKTMEHQIEHSFALPPDTSIPRNLREMNFLFGGRQEFDQQSIDPYEFIWGSTSFDIQNDGAPDLYFLGCMFGRGGGLMALLGTNPGRLLINTRKKAGLGHFTDQTAEHHLFNIHDLKYDRLESEGYVYRGAPAQNWRKRNEVNSFDRSVWTAQGRFVQESIINQDLIQTAENGRAVVAADLNGDGFQDLIIRNQGGYDSRSATAKNLKVKIDNGRTAVLPPPDHNYPVLTEFEPGSTRVFMNQYTENNWLRVRLINDELGQFNGDAIGASVTVNDVLQVMRATQGGYLSNTMTDLHFGLGDREAYQIRIIWPDRQRTEQVLTLENLSRGRLVVSKTKGILEFTEISMESQSTLAHEHGVQ